ncbi:hypothetical protein SAMN05444398_1196 [Roseovarius pacificus]|uniref:Uncharacterized protein n=1 Tax=Roseovarius pacificus TaxID=337701 RepID=A0A1M7JA83_9RHOB|nr:hypothetical protein [Roseovarius pacificus]GGO62022.1 hypothetical protein GCM10011315_40080 [Roseovarius pacificus]SHM49828.1 hypothetical protein SAMN05444398_1196 [Roseovarius pacificus]
MPTATEKLLARIRVLQDELEQEFTRRRAQFRYRLENDRVVFESEIRRHHREFRVRLGTFLRQTRPMVVLTAPVIYSLILPFVLLDLFVTLYQRICFPVYGIARVKRADFIRIDRHHLAYLNGLQKLNCIYCGYCNGLIGYVQEVAGRTEAYWCPIKHAARVGAHHAYYAQFVDYGDAEGFGAGLQASRKQITQAGLSGISPPE